MSTSKICVSSDTPYASPADYLERVDVRLTGDLTRDDGTEATTVELLTDARLAAALADASGRIEAEVLIAGRYTVADLAALTGNSLALLKRITCGLAVQYLRWARGVLEESTYPLYKEAVVMLEALRHGALIFAFAETVLSGLPTTSHLYPDDFFVGLPTLTSNWTRSFGFRSNRRGYGCF